MALKVKLENTYKYRTVTIIRDEEIMLVGGGTHMRYTKF